MPDLTGAELREHLRTLVYDPAGYRVPDPEAPGSPEVNP